MSELPCVTPGHAYEHADMALDDCVAEAEICKRCGEMKPGSYRERKGDRGLRSWVTKMKVTHAFGLGAVAGAGLLVGLIAAMLLQALRELRK